MNTISILQPLSIFRYPLQWLGKIKEQFPFLHYTAIFHFIVTFIAVLAIFIDTREITGINAWIKPTKFLISSFIYLWTIGWYLLFFPFKKISKKIIAGVLSLVILSENAVIITQAYRGVRSHFNMETPFDGMLWAIMGIAIAILTLIMFWFFIKSFSSKIQLSIDQKWAIRIAWLALLVSAYAGNLMATQGAHSIGVVDGGRGLPFLNWSVDGGDLRAAHFLGLHAIQIVPLFLFWTGNKVKSLQLARGLNIGFAILFLIFVCSVFAIAKAGIPLINL